MTIQIEMWRSVRGYENIYSVSDIGRVRSEERFVIVNGRKRHIKERILKLKFSTSGYPVASLARNGEQKKEAVHILVLESFVQPRPLMLEACHNNGDRADPSLSNLRWDTRKANAADRISHGTDARGEKCYNAKLSDLESEEIRESRASQNDLAARYGVHQSTISLIKNGKRWASHLARRIS